MMNELLFKTRSDSTSVPVTRQRTIQAISRSQLPKEADLISAGMPSHSPSAKTETCNYLAVLTQSLCSSHHLEYCRAIGEYNSDRACHAQHEKRSQSCYLQSTRRIGMATATSRVQTRHHARCRRLVAHHHICKALEVSGKRTRLFNASSLLGRLLD